MVICLGIWEPCRSGLTYIFAKDAGFKSPREFESRRLRTNKIGGVDEWFKSAVY